MKLQIKYFEQPKFEQLHCLHLVSLMGLPHHHI